MPRMIDAHHHFWDVQRFDYPWMTDEVAVLRRNFGPADLELILARVGVDQTVVVQARQTLSETRWLLELAQAHDFVAGVVGWADVTAADLEQTLDEFSDRKKLVGFRHLTHDEADPDWLRRDDVLRGLGVLEARGYTFDLLLRPIHLKHVPAVAQAHSGLRLVIDHLAKPDIRSGRDRQAWERDLKAAAQYPNVFCKLSGMITEADPQHWTPADLQPYVQTAVEAFGFDRLMFGSDWPVCTLAGSYPRVVEALRDALGDISDDERDKVMGGVAARFYQLSATPEKEHGVRTP